MVQDCAFKCQAAKYKNILLKIDKPNLFKYKLNKYLFFSIKAKNTLYLEYFRHANHLHIKSGTICATSLESNDSIEYNVDVVIS